MLMIHLAMASNFDNLQHVPNIQQPKRSKESNLQDPDT